MKECFLNAIRRVDGERGGILTLADRAIGEGADDEDTDECRCSNQDSHCYFPALWRQGYFPFCSLQPPKSKHLSHSCSLHVNSADNSAEGKISF
jgi:hypothetical protein